MTKEYELGLYEKALPNYLSIKEKLKIIQKLNFDYMELSIDETDEKLNRLDDLNLQKEIKKSLEKSKIYIKSICLSALRKYPYGSKEFDVRQKGITITKKAIDLAVYLGVRFIQLAGYDVYYEKSDDETKENFLKGLNEVTLYAAKRGVILAFETMENDFMNSITKARKYVDMISSPYLMIYPDLGNLNNNYLKNGSSLLVELANHYSKVVAFHLKDTVQNVYRNLVIGEGIVDFSKSIKVLLDYHVRSFVIEMWHLDDSYLENIKKAKKTIDSIFKKLIA